MISFVLCNTMCTPLKCSERLDRVGTRTTPVLCEGTLTYQHQEKSYTVILGTSAWKNWLIDATLFAVVHECCTFTARKERAGNGRGTWYWRAYYKHRGTLHRIYIGNAEELTLARLNEIAAQLSEQSYFGSSDGMPTTSEQNTLQQQTVHSVKRQAKKYASSRRHHPVLLTTKLSVPHVRPRVVVRPRLYERLQQVTKHKVLLVSAPAGFGKTTLLSAWMTPSLDDRFIDEEFTLSQAKP